MTVGKFRFPTAGDGGNRRLRLFQSHARREPADRMQPPRAPIFVKRRTIFLVPQVFSDCYRRPKIEGKSAHRAEKSRRRDADDGKRVLVYADGFADDAPIASELFLPK